MEKRRLSGYIRRPTAEEIRVLAEMEYMKLTEEEAKDLETIFDEALETTDYNTVKVPFKKLSSDQYTNIAALGVVSALLGLDEGAVAQTVVDFFGKAHQEAAEENRRVLEESYRWAVGEGVGFERLPPCTDPMQRMVMNGNEAIALGAVAAGLKFYSFYPMTPSTSIGLNLARAAGKTGMVVEQAEDEIAAINMAIGASFAGAPSMVATSGGGFALMVEGVSLAGMMRGVLRYSKEPSSHLAA